MSIIYDEPMEVYHANPAIGFHKLLDSEDSLLYYRMKHITGEIAEEKSAAFKFGTFWHAAIFEPAQIIRRYAFADKFDRRTKQGKADAEAFEAANAGKAVLSKDDADLCDLMVTKARQKRKVEELLSTGAPEVVYRAEIDGLPVQCRADWVNPTRDDYRRETLIDGKTIEHLADFPKQMLNFRYYAQAAWYQMVYAAATGDKGYYPRFVFLVSEKSAPYDCALFEVDETALEIGRNECRRLLTRLKVACETNDFPGAPDFIQTLSLPAWKEAQHNEE